MILFLLLIILVVLLFLGRRVLLWPLPSGIWVFIGFPGSGKTTHASMICQRAKKYGVHVYTNIPELESDGVTIIEAWQIGHFDISNGLLIFDECGIEYNNRLSMEKGRMSPVQPNKSIKRASDDLEAIIHESDRFEHLKNLKTMNQASIKWWKLIRHYKMNAIVYSQAQDFDVTIRRLANKLFIIKKSLIPGFSTYRRLAPHWVTDSVSGDPRIEWRFVPFGRHFMRRRRWYKYFNSWSAPALPPLPDKENSAASSN